MSAKKRPGYSPLPTCDKEIDDHVLNYKSPFTYSDMKKTNGYSAFIDVDEPREEEDIQKQSCILQLLSHFLTSISYAIFVLFFPITYWICVKKLREEERMVVFRLGKMIGAKGPGRVLVFPWLDRCVRADISASAFSVPPQQLITNDGGIIEIGAEIQYGITDVVVMVREVADHQDILRSLGKTVLVRLLAKKHISKLTREKTFCANEIMKELNKQIRKWGLIIRCVSLSEIKVLKQPEAMPGMGKLLSGLGLGGNKPKTQEEIPGMGKLLSGLGLGGGGQPKPKEEIPFPSPMEFARSAYSGEKEESNRAETPDLNSTVEKAENGSLDWRSVLEIILNQENNLEQEVYGVYCINIPDKNEKIVVQIGAEGKKVKYAVDSEDLKPDVSVNITSSDLAGVLKGSLPPLQAYLTGRISTSGDVRKLMLFDKLSNRSHKPGTTFNL